MWLKEKGGGAVRGVEAGYPWADGSKGREQWKLVRRSGKDSVKRRCGVVGDFSLGPPRSRGRGAGQVSWCGPGDTCLCTSFLRRASSTRSSGAVGAALPSMRTGSAAGRRAGTESGRGDAGRREAGPSAAPRSHVRLLLAAHLHFLQPLPQGWRGQGDRRPQGPQPGERGRIVQARAA